MNRAPLTDRYYKKACRMLIGAIVAISAFSPAYAEERQYKIESAFLYSFFNYVTWPGYASPQQLQHSVICVYGDDPILPYLEYIRGKIASERTLTLRSVAESEEKDTYTGCHILFIRHRLSPHLLDLIAKDTLVVFKPDDPLDRGGMIELAEDGERIIIKINQPMLEENGFQVSSRLLDLVQKVK